MLNCHTERLNGSAVKKYSFYLFFNFALYLLINGKKQKQMKMQEQTQDYFFKVLQTLNVAFYEETIMKVLLRLYF